MRKSFILLYSLLLRIASSLLNPTKIRTDNRMPPRNMPTNRDVFDVELNCKSLGLGLILVGIGLVTAIRLDSLITNQLMVECFLNYFFCTRNVEFFIQQFDNNFISNMILTLQPLILNILQVVKMKMAKLEQSILSFYVL